jgi:hypothetical protein
MSLSTILLNLEDVCDVESADFDHNVLHCLIRDLGGC